MVDPSVYPFYQRLSQNPDDAEALFVLWQWYGDRGEFQQLATLVEQVAARRLDPTSAADLFYRAGELWAKNVGRVDKAVGSYRRAFELDPGQIPALEAARAIYLQLGNYKLAAQLYDRQLASTVDPVGRATLLRELAGVRAQMGDLSGQITALEELAGITPSDFELLRELAGAYLTRAQAPGGSDEDAMRAATLLWTIAQGLGGEHTLAFAEAALDAWPGEENAFEYVRGVYQVAGRSEELALRQIQFLTANPSSRLASMVRKDLAALYAEAGQIDDAIEALAPLASVDMEAAQTLLGLYRHAGRTQDLADLLSVLPPSPDPAQRVADLREIAEARGQRGERAEMIAALREILMIAPADPEALALIDDDCRARGAFAELRDVLYAAARAPEVTADVRRARLREIALLSEQRLGDLEGATEAWQAVLAIEPGDEEGIAAYERLLSRAERWDELARWLASRATSATEPTTRRALLEQLAEIHRDRRGDAAGEAEALGALWEATSGDDALALRLIDARRRAGDMRGVTEVLRVRAEIAPPEEALSRWTELASHLEQSQERDEAIQAWQQVAALDPANEQAWEAVERLLELTGRHDLLLETLMAHAEGPAAGGRAAALHAAAAEVARTLGDVATATAQASRALEISPENDSIARLLMELLEAAGEYERLIALLRDRAARAPDGALKVELLRRAAHIVGQRDPAAAAAHWRELREVAKRAGLGDDGEAIEALMGFAEASGDAATLAELLREASVVATEPARQRALLVRRAELLARELGRPSEAIETLRDVIERVDPRYAPAWGTIADLALATGKPVLAAEALEEQMRLLDEDEARAAVAARLGALCENELHDRPRAIAAYEAQYDADPTDYALVERLVRLCEAEGRWPEVVRYLEVLCEVEGDEEELSKLVRRTAEIAEARLGSHRRAFDLLAGQAQSGDASALEALRGVAERGGLQSDLVELLTVLANKASGAEERAALWREIAMLQESSRGDRRGALDSWLRALLAQPAATEAIDAIDRLAAELGERDTPARAYRAMLADVHDPERVREVALRGVHFLERIGAPDAALELAVAAQSRAPGDDALLDVVVRLAPAAQRGDEMFIAFDRRRKAARDEGERYELTLRAAESALLLLGDRETAFGYLRQAISLASAGKAPDEAKLALVEASARAMDERNPDAAMRATVVSLYASLSDDAAEDDPHAAAVLARRAGEVCERELGRADHAFAYYARAVLMWPADPVAADRLEALARAERRASEVVDLYQRVIDEAFDGKTARTYRARRAALLSDDLGRVDEAIEALRGVVEIAPKDLEGLRMLQALLRKHGRHQDLLLALDRELEVGSPDPVALLKEVASVWEFGLRNAFEARDAWRRVLGAAPDDPDARAALERLERRRTSDVEDDPEMLDASLVSDEVSRQIVAPPPSDENNTGENVDAQPGTAPQGLIERPSDDVRAADRPTGTPGENTWPGSDASGADREETSLTEQREDTLAPPTGSLLRAGGEQPATTGEDRAMASAGPHASPGYDSPDGSTHERSHVPAIDTGSAHLLADEPSAELLAPDALEEIEPFESVNSAPVSQEGPEEIDEAEEIEEIDEAPSLEALARMTAPPPLRPRSSLPPPPPPGARLSQPPARKD